MCMFKIQKSIDRKTPRYGEKNPLCRVTKQKSWNKRKKRENDVLSLSAIDQMQISK